MKSRKEPTLAVVLTIALLFLFAAAPRCVMPQAVQGRTVSSRTSDGLAAIDAASQRGKYLFVFFWKVSI